MNSYLDDIFTAEVNGKYDTLQNYFCFDEMKLKKSHENRELCIPLKLKDASLVFCFNTNPNDNSIHIEERIND